MRGLALLLLIIPLALNAQPLKRRSFLGVRMENITADIRNLMELPDTAGVLISEIIPGSTAQAAGFKKGDVLRSVNGTMLNNTQQAVPFIAAQSGKGSFTYELLRDRKTVKGKASFKPYPVESYADLDVQYKETKTNAGLQRVIVTKQRGRNNLPLVFFVGGYGCYSLDMPFDSSRSEVQLLNTLARAGYTTVRLEKPGMGDAAGHSTPCSEVGFMEEAENYAASILQLSKQPEFATRSIFIIGHSMGGVMAPIIATKVSVNGIIAYGTIGSNFVEYLAKTRRTLATAYNMTPVETDDYIKTSCECAGYYFVEKMTTRQATAKNAACGEYLPVFDERSGTYNSELYDLNIPSSWSGYKGAALLAWGTADCIASGEDHHIIANAVNHYHPGHAEYVEIPNAEHGMRTAGSFAEAINNPGAYNPEVGRIFLNWLQKHS